MNTLKRKSKVKEIIKKLESMELGSCMAWHEKFNKYEVDDIAEDLMDAGYFVVTVLRYDLINAAEIIVWKENV